MEKYIVDIVLVAIVAVSAFLCAKRGFFLTLASIVSASIAIIGAKLFCNPVAEYVYDNIVRSPVLAKVQSMLPENLTSNNPQAIVDGIVEQLPTGVASLIEKYDLLAGAANVTEDVAGFFSIENLEITYIKPFCLSVLSLFAMVAVFFILFIVFRLLCRLINRIVFKHKKQPVNRLLGAVLGVVRATIPLAVVVVLLNFAADYNLNDSLTAAVENSKICSLVESVSPQLFEELTDETVTRSQNV